VYGKIFDTWQGGKKVNKFEIVCHCHGHDDGSGVVKGRKNVDRGREKR